MPNKGLKRLALGLALITGWLGGWAGVAQAQCEVKVNGEMKQGANLGACLAGAQGVTAIKDTSGAFTAKAWATMKNYRESVSGKFTALECTEKVTIANIPDGQPNSHYTLISEYFSSTLPEVENTLLTKVTMGLTPFGKYLLLHGAESAQAYHIPHLMEHTLPYGNLQRHYTITIHAEGLPSRVFLRILQTEDGVTTLRLIQRWATSTHTGTLMS